MFRESLQILSQSLHSLLERNYCRFLFILQQINWTISLIFSKNRSIKQTFWMNLEIPLQTWLSLHSNGQYMIRWVSHLPPSHPIWDRWTFRVGTCNLIIYIKFVFQFKISPQINWVQLAQSTRLMVTQIYSPSQLIQQRAMLSLLRSISLLQIHRLWNSSIPMNSDSSNIL